MSEREAIELLGQQHVDAALAKDVDAFLATITDDCLIAPPHDKAVRGKDAVRQWVEGFFDNITIQRLEFPSTLLEVDKDVAFKHYAFDWTVVPVSGGAPITDKGNGIYTYRRSADGSWKVSNDLWTSSEPIP
jgi:uncharacterized protein (TIGR02246 family)